jgi:hypothetical protein
MNAPKKTATLEANRRASRRQRGRGNLKVECRKGAHGLGPNAAVSLLDLSELGACLVLKAKWDKGQEVEVLILGGYGTEAIKRLANVVWSQPTENNCYVTGVHFQRALRYGDLQRLTIPANQLQ